MTPHEVYLVLSFLYSVVGLLVGYGIGQFTKGDGNGYS
jgi:hypothetical protein